MAFGRIRARRARRRARTSQLTALAQEESRYREGIEQIRPFVKTGRKGLRHAVANIREGGPLFQLQQRGVPLTAGFAEKYNLPSGTGAAAGRIHGRKLSARDYWQRTGRQIDLASIGVGAGVTGAGQLGTQGRAISRFTGAGSQIQSNLAYAQSAANQQMLANIVYGGLSAVNQGAALYAARGRNIQPPTRAEAGVLV